MSYIMLIPVHTTGRGRGGEGEESVKLVGWNKGHCLPMKVLRRTQGIICDLDG